MSKIASIGTLYLRRDRHLQAAIALSDLHDISCEPNDYLKSAKTHLDQANYIEGVAEAFSDLKKVCDEVQKEHGTNFKLKHNV